MGTGKRGKARHFPLGYCKKPTFEKKNIYQILITKKK
jgi:hypothetical protein